MTFISLYRKYRPQKFADLVGQQQVVQTLKNSIKFNRIAHAYLFAGPRGTGKTSTAKVYARALNCLEDNGIEPCGECENCYRIEKEESMDVIEIDAASNRGIDEIRELREQVKFYPGEGRYKIYIIDEVHMLTRQAFNALLKTLEEPPEKVIFILATTEPHNVIPTIMSRCQRFDFSLLSCQQIVERLEFISEKEGVKTGEYALDLLADASDGGMRDAISLLDQAISYCGKEITVSCLEKMLGKVEVKTLSEMVNKIAEQDTGELLKIAADLQRAGRSAGKIAGDLLDYCRELMLTVNGDFGLAASGLAENRRQLIKEDSRHFNQGEINYIVDKLVELEGRLRRSARPDILLELALVQITEPGSDESPAGLTRRLAKLEKQLEERGKREVTRTREEAETAEKDKVEKNKEEDKTEEDKVEEDKTKENKDERDKKIQHPSLEGASAKSEALEADKSEDTEDSIDYSREEAETAADSAAESSDETIEAEEPEAPDSSEEDKTSVRDLTASLWEEILDSIKEADIKTHAMIKESRQPVLQGGSLILNFPPDKKFHLQSARKESEFIQQKIAEVLDIDSKLELEFQLDGSTLQDKNRNFQQKSKTSSRANSSTGSNRSDQSAGKVRADSSDLIKQAQQIFGGEIISVSAEVLQEQKEILANLKGGSKDEHEENDETGPADAG